MRHVWQKTPRIGHACPNKTGENEHAECDPTTPGAALARWYRWSGNARGLLERADSAVPVFARRRIHRQLRGRRSVCGLLDSIREIITSAPFRPVDDDPRARVGCTRLFRCELSRLRRRDIALCDGT